jgi:hypothetical protein
LKNVNFAKVRPATVLTKIALAASLLAAAGCLAGPARAGAEPRVTVALLPNGTHLSALEAVPGISPGLLSAGLGEVSAEQTYLDITQGNRVFDSLYDGELPRLVQRNTRIEGWGSAVARADSAPAEIVPGLLASSLRSESIAVGSVGLGSVIGADRAGRIHPTYSDCVGKCPAVITVSTVEVIRAGTRDLPRLARGLRDDDLLIALERPPPAEHAQLVLGIAGAGFDGNLTSDSTRMDGYVSSTDLAPTILGRLGLPVPAEMDGAAVRTEGSPDFGAVTSLGDRLAAIPSRRASVVGFSLLAWALAAGLAALLGRGRTGLRLLALSVAYLPLLLLVGAALRPSEAAEQLLLALGAPLLAAATLAVLCGYRALAVACALTTAGCAIDVIAGSPLTSLSLIGPNPAGGVRFYGIGNELEAILAPLVIVGTGAAIAGFAAGLSRRAAAIAFLAVAAAAAVVFAAGRFGADVGAAIVFPAGAAAAAAVISGRRSLVWLALAAPLLALALLAVIDLVSGGDSHLTRSVLDAGGLSDLADVAERRLRLSAISFGRAAGSPVFWALLGVAALAVAQRRRVSAWFAGNRTMQAAFAGAAAATVVGTLANDSGALLLEVGIAYLLAFSGYVWAEQAESGSPARIEGVETG